MLGSAASICVKKARAADEGVVVFESRGESKPNLARSSFANLIPGNSEENISCKFSRAGSTRISEMLMFGLVACSEDRRLPDVPNVNAELNTEEGLAAPSFFAFFAGRSPEVPDPESSLVFRLGEELDAPGGKEPAGVAGGGILEGAGGGAAGGGAAGVVLGLPFLFFCFTIAFVLFWMWC